MKERSKEAAGRVDITTLLSYRILILSSTLARWAAREYWKRFRLKLAEWRILSIVGARGSMSVNTVSDAISVDKAWISRTVPKLVKRGLLRVAGDSNDRRRTLLQITPKGALIHTKMSEISVARQQRLVKGLTALEMRELKRLLALLQSEAETMLGEQTESEPKEAGEILSPHYRAARSTQGRQANADPVNPARRV